MYSQTVRIEVDSIYPSIERIASQLTHVSTSHSINGNERIGVTRWETSVAPGLWFEWDWAEVKPHVIAHNNAPKVRTNLELVYRGGRCFNDCDRHKALSVLVYLLAIRSLSWQQIVLDTLPPYSNASTPAHEKE